MRLCVRDSRESTSLWDFSVLVNASGVVRVLDLLLLLLAASMAFLRRLALKVSSVINHK